MENFKLTNYFTIKGISAASGLVYSQNVLFVISDSSNFLYQYDIDKKLLLKFPLVKDAKENIEKSEKMSQEYDYEDNTKILDHGFVHVQVDDSDYQPNTEKLYEKINTTLNEIKAKTDI